MCFYFYFFLWYTKLNHIRVLWTIINTIVYWIYWINQFLNIRIKILLNIPFSLITQSNGYVLTTLRHFWRDLNLSKTKPTVFITVRFLRTIYCYCLLIGAANSQWIVFTITIITIVSNEVVRNGNVLSKNLKKGPRRSVNRFA